MINPVVNIRQPYSMCFCKTLKAHYKYLHFECLPWKSAIFLLNILKVNSAKIVLNISKVISIGNNECMKWTSSEK